MKGKKLPLTVMEKSFWLINYKPPARNLRFDDFYYLQDLQEAWSYLVTWLIIKNFINDPQPGLRDFNCKNIKELPQELIRQLRTRVLPLLFSNNKKPTAKQEKLILFLLVELLSEVIQLLPADFESCETYYQKMKLILSLAPEP